MSDILNEVPHIRGILTCELRIQGNEGILELGLDKLKTMLSQCQKELEIKYGSWEKAGDPLVSLITDMDDLSHIILDKKDDFPTNVRIYLCDSLAYKLDKFAGRWSESEIE